MRGELRREFQSPQHALADVWVRARREPPAGIQKPMKLEMTERAADVAIATRKAYEDHKGESLKKNEDLERKVRALEQFLALHGKGVRDQGNRAIYNLENQARRAAHRVDAFTEGSLAPLRRLIAYITTNGDDTLRQREIDRNSAQAEYAEAKGVYEVETDALERLQLDRMHGGLKLLHAEMDHNRNALHGLKAEADKADEILTHYAGRSQQNRYAYVLAIAETLPEDISTLSPQFFRDLRNEFPNGDPDLEDVIVISGVQMDPAVPNEDNSQSMTTP